jgi:hypothetical protein
MGKKYRLAIASLIFLFSIVSLVAYQLHVPHELILKKNGLPLANLTGDMLPMGCPGPNVTAVSTDANGRLDLSNLPTGADGIILTLRDRGSIVYNGTVLIPTRGSRTIDLCGKTTVVTTRYLDCGLFRYTEQQTIVDLSSTAPADAKTGQPPSTHRGQPSSPPAKPGT